MKKTMTVKEFARLGGLSHSKKHMTKISRLGVAARRKKAKLIKK